MNPLSAGFDVFKRHPIEWTMLGLLFGILQFIGIGIIFFGNLVRIARKSGDTGSGPDISALFSFEHLVDDVLTVLFITIAAFAGLLLCGVGAIVAGWLTIWAIHLNADGLFTPIDCLKASFQHAKSNVFEIALTLLTIAIVVVIASVLTCGLGLLVATPITILSIERFYASKRNEILAAASNAGILRKA